MKQVSDCCKQTIRTITGSEGTNYYECTNCCYPCDPYTPQRRCKTCGRFIKEDGIFKYFCVKCLVKEPMFSEAKRPEEQMDEREPGIWWDRMEKQDKMMDRQFNEPHQCIFERYVCVICGHIDARPKEYKAMQQNINLPQSNQQIYTEMVEWMYINDRQYNDDTYEWRRGLLAKLKSLLGLT